MAYRSGAGRPKQRTVRCFHSPARACGGQGLARGSVERKHHGTRVKEPTGGEPRGGAPLHPKTTEPLRQPCSTTLDLQI